MIQPLILDASPWQRDTIPPSAWARLAADPAYAAVILKAGEGLTSTEVWRGRRWLFEHAAAVRETRLDLGYYWYLRLGVDGAAQADAYAKVLEREPGTLRAIIDIEEGSGNDDIVSARGAGIVSEVAGAFSERIEQRTGLPPIMYAGGWLRSLGLRDRMGCAALWIAAYVAKLPASAWCAQLGFTAAELWAWQYAGLGARGMDARLEGYPRTAPIGDADISVVVHPGGVAAMRWVEQPCLQ